MIREDFEKGVADYDLARTSTSLAQEEIPRGSPEGGDPVLPVEGEKTQVASAASSAAAKFGAKVVNKFMGKDKQDLINRSSRTLVKNKPKKPAAAGTEGMDQMLKDFEQFQVQEKPNVDLSQIEQPADIDRLVEQAASNDFPESRNWVEIQKRTSTVKKVMEELRPITEGRQTGPLSDVQLHGVSRIVVTAFDDVERLLPKVASGKATAEEILMLASSKSTYETMEGYLRGQSSETARALNSLKMSKKTLESKDLAAYKSMTEGPKGGLSKYMKEWADAVQRRMEKGDGVSTAMKWASATIKSDPIRASVEFWKNNQLSGLKTHVVNNTSVWGHMLYENIAIRPLAAAVGAVRTGARTDVDRVQTSEMMAPIYSAAAGLRGWMGLFWDNLAHGQRNFIALDKVEDSHTLSGMIQKSGAPEPVKKVADFATAGSFKILTATDEANRGIAFTQELYALASRRATMDGAVGKDHVALMNKYLDDPPYEMYNQAMDHAAQMTFTDVEKKGWIAATSKALRVMTGEIPPLQFIIPYINTPSRLLHVATEMSPLAPLSKRLRDDIKAGGAKADIAIAKMTAGMGMGVMYWQLYESGIISGGGPDDYKAQEMLKADGWQPWAIQADGKSYSMERMEPFSKSAKFTEGIATFFGYMDKAKYAATDEEKESNMIQGMLYLSQYMMEDQWMEQATGLMKVLEGSESMEKFIARTGAGFVPYHAAFKSIKEFQDPARRQMTSDKIISGLDQMMADQIEGNMPNIPGIEYGSKQIRPKRTWDGKVLLPRMSVFASAATPFGPSELKKDPATQELFENGVIPQEPSEIINLGPKKFSLQQLGDPATFYDRYVELVGISRRETVEIVMANPRYQQTKKDEGTGPNTPASLVLEKAIRVGKLKGLVTFLEELATIAEKHPDKATPLAEKLGDDPVALIRQTVYDINHDLLGEVKLRAVRGPLEYPISDENIPEMK